MNYSEYELQYMTRPEAEKVLKKYRKAILPLGATEQHGPHLPLGTDTFLAHYMSLKLAEKIKAVVLPAIPVSYSWVWRDIPGSLVLTVDRVKGIAKDIARSLERFNLEQLIIVNGHGANNSALKYAVRELADELEMEIYYFTYPGLEKAAKHSDSPMWHNMVHACEMETSWLLAVRPDLCKMDEAVREYPGDKKSYKYHNSSLPMGALSESGVFGDATRATREKGEVMLKELVDYMVKVLEAGSDKKTD